MIRSLAVLTRRSCLSHQGTLKLVGTPGPSPKPLPRATTYLTDQKVRGAHDSIKTSTPAEMLGWGPRPGVERSGTPGTGSIKTGQPAEAGRSRCDCKTSFWIRYRPLRRLGSFLVTSPRGSRPGLYAVVRSAHSVRSVKYVITLPRGEGSRT